MKPDYKLEQSKAKRAADLIEFGERVLSILLSERESHGRFGYLNARAGRFAIWDAARSLGLLDDAPREEDKP